MRLKLAEWLAIRNVNQSQLAAALGLSRATVSTWIKGRTVQGVRMFNIPDPETIGRLCMFLECTPNDLLEIDSQPPERTWRDFKPTVAA